MEIVIILSLLFWVELNHQYFCYKSEEILLIWFFEIRLFKHYLWDKTNTRWKLIKVKHQKKERFIVLKWLLKTIIDSETNPSVIFWAKMAESLEQKFAIGSLNEQLECPVCLELPKSPPIYQCPNGHMVCNICHGKLQECPQCREPLGKNRNLFAENIMKWPCPFAKHGCTDRFATNCGNDHQKKCQFREVPCPHYGCTEKNAIK